MPRRPALPRLEVSGLGPVDRAVIDFGDLTVLVGPQAAGKTILLETLKLCLDRRPIVEMLRRQGYDWGGEKNALIDLYYGEGMRALFTDRTSITWKRRPVELGGIARGSAKGAGVQTAFYIPAHRALTLKHGWPRNFGDYSAGDPYVVREFSENLRVWMELTGPVTEPTRGRLSPTTAQLVQTSIFGKYELKLERRGPQKRLVLGRGKETPLPFMVWSAGQREFSPLLLGLRLLLSEATPHEVEWIVIEEPEMGLHPLAITAVLFVVLELLSRGFRVCLSTHSPHVLDLLWALRVFRERGAEAGQVLELFKVGTSAGNQAIAAAALEKEIRVYSFDRESGGVEDISRLDPGSSTAAEVTWGGLVGFSTHVSDVVAGFVANLKDP